jgi:hypothetical protein
MRIYAKNTVTNEVLTFKNAMQAVRHIEPLWEPRKAGFEKLKSLISENGLKWELQSEPFGMQTPQLPPQPTEQTSGAYTPQLPPQPTEQTETKKTAAPQSSIQLTEEQKKQFMNLLNIDTAIDKDVLENMLAAYHLDVLAAFNVKVDEVLEKGAKRVELKVGDLIIKSEGAKHMQYEKTLRIFLSSQATNSGLYLFGDAGNGKTHLATQILNDLGKTEGADYEVQSCNPETATYELFGFISPTTSKFNAGSVYRCMTEGKVLILDELDRLPARTLLAFNRVLEKNTYLFDSGETVKAKEGFSIIGTGNSTLNGGSSKFMANKQDSSVVTRVNRYKIEVDEALEYKVAPYEFTNLIQDVRKQVKKLGIELDLNLRLINQCISLAAHGLTVAEIMDIKLFTDLNANQKDNILKGLDTALLARVQESIETTKKA